MRLIAKVLFVAVSTALLVACSDFKEENVPTGFSIDSKELYFSSNASSQSMSVSSGKRWDIPSLPDWVSVQSITTNGLYQWTVSFSVSENNNYNRAGTILFQSSAGSAEVAVKQEGKKGAFVPVTSVSLSSTDLSLTEGDSCELVATVHPSDASEKTISWSSDNTSVATVSSSGLVFAKSVGYATITVITDDGGKIATCSVKVNPISVSSVTLDKESLSLIIGETSSLTVKIYPDNAANKNVSWSSSDTNVATVDSNGMVTAVGVGSAKITVKTEDGGKTATCSVKVNPVSVSSVTLDKESLSLIVGETSSLIATVLPDNATNKDVSWSSSDTNVATVNWYGMVTAVGVGSAKITVKTEDGGKTATCSVKVNPVSVSSVTLDKESLSLIVGETSSLTANVLPDNATNKSVTWSSSNTSVAKVSSDGVVTAVNKGSSIITVITKDGGYKAECTVNVTIPVVSVSLEPKSLSLSYGQQATLVATISPSDASNQSVVWSSSNTSVATVSSSGVVYAAGGGSATITVRTVDGGYEAKCNVSVVVNVSGITLNKTSLSMTQYDTETLIATIVPSNATNKNVVWSSDHPTVASVTSNGVVSAIGVGSAIITVTTEDSGYKATCNVSVTADPYEAVDLGLSVKWASMNYGASRENEVGGYYMWGDPIGNAVPMEYSAPNISSISGTQYDIVRCNWGGKWRIPSTTEIRELYNNCTWAWTTSGGVSGVRVTGRNGNSIFIPVSGYALPASGPIGTTQTTDTTSGYMMSGNSYLDSGGYGRFAYVYYFSTQTFYNSVSYNANFVKFPIRPVR